MEYIGWVEQSKIPFFLRSILYDNYKNFKILIRFHFLTQFLSQICPIWLQIQVSSKTNIMKLPKKCFSKHQKNNLEIGLKHFIEPWHRIKIHVTKGHFLKERSKKFAVARNLQKTCPCRAWTSFLQISCNSEFFAPFFKKNCL